MKCTTIFGVGLAACAAAVALATAEAQMIVAEGEQFTPRDQAGWRVTHADQSYGSHTYGGMWLTHGGCLGAPADSTNSVAVQKVTVPVAGQYRIWSKYQSPPYFNYLHRIDILQGGKTVYSHDYGRDGTPRLWSYSGVSAELWWPWGVDHDAAEAPTTMASLAAGDAEIRLIAIPNPAPAGDRFVDFVVLTTNPDDTYQGFKPYAVATPFANEALAATRLYMRFRNTLAAAAQLTVTRREHFQPNYGSGTTNIPDTAVASGAWSPRVNIGPFCRLVHNEGLVLTLPGAGEVEAEFSRDADGKDPAGKVKVQSGESVNVPMTITWDKKAVVRASRELGQEVIGLGKTWRTANGGKKPKDIFFYGAFGKQGDWVNDLKDTLGYNTQLPDQYEHIACDGVVDTYAPDRAQLESLAANRKDKQNVRVISFGDEISIGRIDFKDPAMQLKFPAWLKAKGLTTADLGGTSPAEAKLTESGNARLVWYSNLFNEEERFASYRELTALARTLFGPQVLTGANYSPHHLALCYGPIYQWVDFFKQNGMTMFWTEDYIFSIPELPQAISWQFAEMRCATKYNHQPIQMYVMPHAPGQLPSLLRRNTLLSVGYGAAYINNFWVAPQENFTENFVAWGYNDTFRAIHEAIFDTAEAEPLQAGGSVRQARVAVVLSKATEFNETQLMIPKAKDAFAARCANAPEQVNQIICRKDQQMLYLALRQAGHAVDLITEDDIADGLLKGYEVVYFAGEWIDHRAIKVLDAWVKAGGILYACAGSGRFNEFGEPDPDMAALLGIKYGPLDKNMAVIRTLLELPQMPTIGTITLDAQKIAAVGLKQAFVPDTARVLGTWEDGKAAVTVRDYGKGKAFAVGTLAGNTYMKTGLKVQPWARGGEHTVYNPTHFDAAATRLVRLGVDAKAVVEEVTCSQPLVEAIPLDSKQGTLLTLVNWTDAPVKGLQVSVRMDKEPKSVRSVQQGKNLKAKFKDGRLTFTTDLEWADYILLPR